MDRIAQLEEEQTALRKRLLEIENELSSLKTTRAAAPASSLPLRRLRKNDIERYGRQLIMEDIGVTGQCKLLSASVAVVGAGGLGSPAALYLAGAGVGRLGIIDFDVVEMSNLHRQVIHSDHSVGVPKAQSARQAVLRLNPSIDCVAYDVPLSGANALGLLRPFDVVLDATDNVATRYLLNDACVLLGKPLVSGSAIRLEGQATVYNYKGGPCYRCLFPTPPPRETVSDCSNSGVLGAVPGVIGCVQAVEAVKVITDIGEVLSRRLLFYDALAASFRVAKLRARRPDCAVCGDQPTITTPIDYVQFCGSSYNDKAKTVQFLDPTLCVSVTEFAVLSEAQPARLLIGVRPKVQFDTCSLPNSRNLPLDQLPQHIDELRDELSLRQEPAYFVCRRGNASQHAIQRLRAAGVSNVLNVDGGLLAWATHIDRDFPLY
eukprot:TRINITY_DN10851_c0_g1_i1.p1 TRINITY_DN10851_c0_g1~~TRINITY_DN10851_c0_g1_i1.p1  ORF type:complete len:433 (+),score=126.56 TRINITY_DN10851_c0_g1_i1:154-1452(+)